MSFTGFVGHLLQDDAEKPEGDNEVGMGGGGRGRGPHLFVAPPVKVRVSPHDDNDEVEEVPAVADVGAGVQHQSVGNDLQERLHREDDEENVLHLFLCGGGDDDKGQGDGGGCWHPHGHHTPLGDRGTP